MPSLRTERHAPLPETFDAQLATLVKAAPEGNEWLHEVKYDGYRIGCRIDRGDVRLLSRRGNDWTAQFPEVRREAERLRVHQALIDGEVAIVLPDGRTSFQALQNAFAGAPRAGLTYFVFDLLHLDGDDLSSLRLEQRKAMLRKLLQGFESEVIRYAQHWVGHGTAVHREACRLGLEGVVSKRRDLPYRPGRHPTWLKTKCVQRQELVVGGFTDPEGSREGIGSLLVGYFQDGRLQFAGKVGTGYTRESARALRKRLEALEQRSPPFSPPPSGWLGRHAHWTAPEIVVEVAFTEWTGDGKLRHPSFQGVREDKPAVEVAREAPRARRNGEGSEVAGVRISHPERVFYPERGITKLDLARFFEGIAEWILPHLRGRPLTLVRCPERVGEGCYFMKHSKVWAPEQLRRVRIPEKTKLGEYLIADTLPALIGLVQMDVIEIHTWNSHIDQVERPNRLVLDLDPGPAVSWSEVIAAARLVRTVLEAVGLKSFVKNTGGNGLHVVVPLEPEAEWSECLAFARSVASAIARQDPSRYTTSMAKAGRERKILIDYLRNNRTNTSVAAFSTRARPEASVSVPLHWDELSPRVPSNHYTVENLDRRLAHLREDPWAEYGRIRQRLPSHAREALQRL